MCGQNASLPELVRFIPYFMLALPCLLCFEHFEAKARLPMSCNETCVPEDVPAPVLCKQRDTSSNYAQHHSEPCRNITRVPPCVPRANTDQSL